MATHREPPDFDHMLTRIREMFTVDAQWILHQRFKRVMKRLVEQEVNGEEANPLTAS